MKISLTILGCKAYFSFVVNGWGDKKMAKSKTLDMCTGPFLKKIILFSLPLIATGLLQIFFTAADKAVLGQFAGDNAISAVGSTASTVNAIVAIALGLSNGAGVVVAQNIGAKNKDAVEKAVHSSLLLSVTLGVILGIMGIFFSKTILSSINTPPEVLNLAALYLKIYFAGLPLQLLYNFSSSVLRAIGDTAKPLIFLFISGILNIILNLIFVIIFDMSVAGVALATVISQAVSAVMIVVYMMNLNNDCKVTVSKLKFNKIIIKRILYIGIPAGLQEMIFSVSNIIMQSSINSFGTMAMAGVTAASSLADCVHISMVSIHQASTTVIGQNVGAKKFGQVKKLSLLLFGCVIAIGVFSGSFILIFREPLLKIFTSTPEALRYGYTYLSVIISTYFLCGCMDVAVGCVRGMGNSLQPMIISIFGICILRFVWIFAVFPFKREFWFLILSYPITWAITFSLQLIVYSHTFKKLSFKIENANSQP